jgi:hypothetical protein
MLSGLSEEAANCYRRAAECRELAKLATNRRDRVFYLEREKSWVKLAASYQLSERLDLVINETKKRRGVTETRACPACKKVTPIHYSTVFVCTNCHLVFDQ